MALPPTSPQEINKFPGVLSMTAILKKIKYCNDSITLVSDSLANIEVRTRRLCRTVGKILIIFMWKTSLAVTAGASNPRTALEGRHDNQQTSLHVLAAAISCAVEIPGGKSCCKLEDSHYLHHLKKHLDIGALQLAIKTGIFTVCISI